MILLFDQNLSPNLPRRLSDIYPASTHVCDAGLSAASDADLWEYAKSIGAVIVSKDSDFQQRSLLYGSPPKVVWLRIGNCPARTVEELLQKYSVVIHTFFQDDIESLLILP